MRLGRETPSAFVLLAVEPLKWHVVRTEGDWTFVRNGACVWCGIFFYEEVEGFTDEKRTQVVGGLVPYFGQEENDFNILGQMFAELHKLVFLGRAKEVLNVINTEDFYVGWVDDFTLEHMHDTSNGCDDDMRSFLQSLHILVDVGPPNGEVGGDRGRSGRRGNQGLGCLRSFATWTKNDCLSLLEGVVELFDDYV